MSDHHFDVLIIGAGISGIGVAYHLQTKCPDQTYAILEGRDAIGGTWDLFRYPGIRSDSDMHTLGYSFKPWREDKAIVDGASIRNYVDETAQENEILPHIHFEQQVKRASWSSETARWTVEVTDKPSGETRLFTANFIAMCTGYYDYESGYMPSFVGEEDFSGPIIHPQKWPEDLDYTNKSVVVIGSGATAMTIVPNMVDKAKHVTLLQRSPTYVVSRPSMDRLANALRRLLPSRWAYALTRAKNIWIQQYTFNKARTDPKRVREILLNRARKKLHHDYVDAHFTPTYNPWEQRICLIPDNDLFSAINSGSVSVETDNIDRFTEKGIRLASGKILDADIVIAATGLELQHLGGIEVHVDGEKIDFSKTWTYKGLAYSGVPNLVSSFGYFNASWTMKVDLTADYICRLINHMARSGTSVCVPVQDFNESDIESRPWIEGFSSGYIARRIHTFPKQCGSGPWIHSQSFDMDKKLIGKAPVDDDVMRFSHPTEIDGLGLSPRDDQRSAALAE